MFSVKRVPATEWHVEIEGMGRELLWENLNLTCDADTKLLLELQICHVYTARVAAILHNPKFPVHTYIINRTLTEENMMP